MTEAPPPGTVVVWTHENFNPEYWDKLSEDDRRKFYGWAGYGQEPKYPGWKKAFVFICPIISANAAEFNDSGHCVLLDLDDGHLEYMRHTAELRPATEDEF